MYTLYIYIYIHVRAKTWCTVLSTVVQGVHVSDDSSWSSHLAATLRSRATNSQARRFVIAIYDRGPSLFLRGQPPFHLSLFLPLSLSPFPYFPTSRALNGVLNNGFIYGAAEIRGGTRSAIRDGRVYDAENTNCEEAVEGGGREG